MSMHQSNPYDFIAPVKDPKHFAGRNEELKEIEYYIDEARGPKPIFFNLALIGGRGSGKTSLLNMIGHIASEKGLLAVKLSLNNEVVESDVRFFKDVFDTILTKGIERGMFGGPTDKIQRALRKVNLNQSLH